MFVRGFRKFYFLLITLGDLTRAGNWAGLICETPILGFSWMVWSMPAFMISVVSVTNLYDFPST